MTYPMPAFGGGLIEDDRIGLEDLVSAASDIDAVEEDYLRLLDAAAGEFPEFARSRDLFRDLAHDLLARMKEALHADTYERHLSFVRTRFADLSRRGMSASSLAAAMLLLRGAIYGRAARRFEKDPAALSRLLRVGERYLARDVAVIIGESERVEKARFAAAAESGAELTTPVIQVWEGILAAPLIGALDSDRAARFTEQVLDEIVRTQAEAILIDITGVSVIDTGVANHLFKAIRPSYLLRNVTACL